MKDSFDPFEEDPHGAHINMTPLIDVIFVLLIIFMVTSSFHFETGLDIDLPKTQSKTKESQNQAVIISLDAAGTLYVQGQEIPFAQLESSLKDHFSKHDTKVVVLEGDRFSTLEKTLEIMDIAKAAGAQKFAIAALDKEN